MRESLPIYRLGREGRAPWDWRHLSLGFAPHLLVGLKRGDTSLEFEVPPLPLDSHNSKSHAPPLLHDPTTKRGQPLGSCAQGKGGFLPLLGFSPHPQQDEGKCPLTQERLVFMCRQLKVSLS